MKLSTLTATNFKGLNFTLDLKDINFLVGSNFAGKTARADAIRFLLLGYLPELGKTNTATFGLASGRDMEVSGKFDDGTAIVRRLYLQGDLVKAQNIVPKAFEECGPLAVMLNAETYFALSDRERVNYVFANVQLPDTYTQEGICNQIAATLATAGPSPTALNIGTSLRATKSATPQDFVEQALAWLTVEAKSAKDHAARMEKTTQGVAGLKAQETGPSIKAMAEIEAERNTITTKITALQQTIADHRAAANQVQAANTRRQQLERATKELPNLRNQSMLLTERLEQATRTHAAMPAADPVAIEKLIAEQRQLEQEKAVDGAELKRTIATINQNKNELNEIDGKTICPFCGASGDGWKTLRTSEINSVISAMMDKGTALNHSVAGKTARLQTIHDLLMAAKTDMHRFETTKSERDRLQTEMKDLQNKLIVLVAASEELAALPTTSQAAVDALREFEAELTAANSYLALCDAQRKASIQREQDKKRMAEAEEQRDQAKADLATFVTAGKRLREIQGEMVTAAFTPLLATANSFFGTVLKTPIAYNQGEIGTWRSGIWVSHRTFSGTEKALTYAAIQAALASKSPVRIMMIDELGRLDTANLTNIEMAAASAIEAGLIDQFLGIDATDRFSVGSSYETPMQTITIS